MEGLALKIRFLSFLWLFALNAFSALMVSTLMVSAISPAYSYERGGGVPSMAALSVGFGDDDLLVINGIGVLGFVEMGASDIWISGGLYTNLVFAGDLSDKSDEMARSDDDGDFDLPHEGVAFEPGLALGLTLGFNSFDFYILGMAAPSFALVTHYQQQGDEKVKVDDLDPLLGFNYGAMFVLSYKGNQPWLRGVSLGFEFGYHDKSFDRQHLGVTLGVAF